MIILQVRLHGQPDGSFHNIKFPFDDLHEVISNLNSGDFITGESLHSKPTDDPRTRRITGSRPISISHAGVDWIVEPTVQFID